MADNPTVSAPPSAPSTGGSDSDSDSSSGTTPVILVIGMAGAGKSMLMQRMSSYLAEKHARTYGINLDPAVVGEVSFPANVDIRDTIKYKDLMKEHNLGPNGAIVLSLNLFTTQFDQFSELLSQRAKENDYFLVDTPGQIEIFTWSAGGAIICDVLASKFPTVVVYVVDTVRCQNPVTFMSNMLYTCSILYKTRLPFVVVFNKTDIISHEFAVEWMRDFEAFEESVSQESSYTAGLARSLSLVLNEFYSALRVVGVSAARGDGMDELFAAIRAAAVEFETDYKPALEKLRREKEEKDEKKREADLERLKKDKTAGMKVAKPPSAAGAAATIPRTAKVKLHRDLGYGKGRYDDLGSDDEDIDDSRGTGLGFTDEQGDDDDDDDDEYGGNRDGDEDDEDEGEDDDGENPYSEEEKDKLQRDLHAKFLAAQNADHLLGKK